jgi:hypothetical protein
MNILTFCKEIKIIESKIVYLLVALISMNYLFVCYFEHNEVVLRKLIHIWSSSMGPKSKRLLIIVMISFDLSNCFLPAFD